MAKTPGAEIVDLINGFYSDFNARKVDDLLAAMSPDVDWPNMLDGTRVHGRDAVRGYWLRQFESIDPHVEPRQMSATPDGRIVVDVHQVVRDLEGKVVADHMVQHIYTFRDGLVARMDVRQS